MIDKNDIRPQAPNSSQTPVSTPFSADVNSEGQALNSSQTPVSTPFSAPYYVLDPGTKAGILSPDGDFILRGVGIKKPRTKGFSMEQVLLEFSKQPVYPIYTEMAVLPNGKGMTEKLIQTLMGMGFEVWVQSTRHAYKDRAPICQSGHKAKQPGCDECTKRDLLAMQIRVEKHLRNPEYGGFYRPTFNRKKVGSKNVSGDLAAEINTELNILRFEKPMPYASVESQAPAWLLSDLNNDLMAVATICVVAKHVVRRGHGRRLFRRALADNGNARKCLPHSNLVFHYTGDKAQYSKSGMAYFKQLRDSR